MPQDPNEFSRDLQNLISEALAAGIPEADIVSVLEAAAEELDSGEGDDAADNPA